MIPISSDVRVWLSTSTTDMRRGMNGLALQVQQMLGRDPHRGDLYVFRGKSGDLIMMLWHDGLGMLLYSKLLERLVWPSPADGVVLVTATQLATCWRGSTGGTHSGHLDPRWRAEGAGQYTTALG